jgi:D-tyrosyl-tRNA(Tyr) deacylase
VAVDGEVVGRFDGPGVVALVGVTHTDGQAQVAWMAKKIAELRLFDDETSLVDRAGSVLLVSQFTLYADLRKGRRPSWSKAAPGNLAEPLVDALAEALRAVGLFVAQGRFGAAMEVRIVNDGPYTLVVDSPEVT